MLEILIRLIGHGIEESKAIAVLQATNKTYHRKFTDTEEQLLVRFAAEVSLTFQKRILDVRTYSLTNRQKEEYLEEGFLKEYGIGIEKTSFRMRQRSESEKSSENDSPSGMGTSRFTLGRAMSFFSNENKINQWNLNPFRYDDSQLSELIAEIFQQSGCMDTFFIHRSKLMNFVTAVKNSYHPANPFHNFNHAFSVLHLTYMIILSGANEKLLPIDLLALLIAALCHDLDHPGNTK